MVKPFKLRFCDRIMNLVSFDSILSAIALTEILGMATAILFSGVLMMVIADKVSDFEENRIASPWIIILFIVGIMLTTKAAILAHLEVYLLTHGSQPCFVVLFWSLLISSRPLPTKARYGKGSIQH